MAHPSSIWCRDSNSRPLDNDSPPITTRPGLPPYQLVFVNGSFKSKFDGWLDINWLMRTLYACIGSLPGSITSDGEIIFAM